eukprot:CAMPEP_0168500646 /NCGR_PEP_ID=MMETSP0228-20121227/74396_1 /TAXON_ID=133427 /ORGANISM="Protoceratium reticulatum, Strain CCCM 535 (=CCMP 1889)" /LENGTH=48 /DNA_ID= /DNA_START= /DNA_END= /DNA_ORIENTATION=
MTLAVAETRAIAAPFGTAGSSKKGNPWKVGTASAPPSHQTWRQTRCAA